MRPRPSSTLHQPLDLVLGSPSLVRVLRVLVKAGGSIGVSEIARRADLSLPSVRSALERLLEMGLVSSVDVGRSMACSFWRDGPLAVALVALFDGERTMAGQVQRALHFAVRSVDTEPLAVWFIGAAVRGEPTHQVRVVIVTDGESPPTDARRVYHAAGGQLPRWAPQIFSVVALSRAHVQRLVAGGSRWWQELEQGAAVVAGYSPSAIRRWAMNEETSRNSVRQSPAAVG